MRLARAVLATVLGLAFAPEALAQAWPVKNRWSDPARPGDPTSGSFAWEYGQDAVAAAGSFTTMGTKLDCADLAIATYVDYAARNNLECLITLHDPAANGQVRTVSSNDPRFKNPGQFRRFALGWTNAKMLGQLNTVTFPREQLRRGDLFVIRWNQLPGGGPFPGRDVWHTYLVAEPDQLLFYGNDDAASQPLPVTATAESDDLGRVRNGVEVYEGLPRRWKVVHENLVPPKTPLVEVTSPLDPREATVTASKLNIRSIPSLAGKVLKVVPKGAKARVEGRAPNGWLRLRFADNSIGYAKDTYLAISPVPPDFRIARDWVPPTFTNPAPNPTPGIVGTVPE